MKPWFLSQQFWGRVLTPLAAVMFIAVIAMLATDLLLPQRSTPRRATASSASPNDRAAAEASTTEATVLGTSTAAAVPAIGGRDQPSSFDLMTAISARPSDIGVVDKDGSGFANWVLGESDGAVVIGENAGDRSDIRFVFDFVLTSADLGTLRNSVSSTLVLGLGKVEGVRDGQEVVLERLNPASLAADAKVAAFEPALEIDRSPVSSTDRSVSFDIGSVIPTAGEVLAFRVRLSPTITDTAASIVGIATADVLNPERRPRILVEAKSPDGEQTLLTVGGLAGCPAVNDPVVELIRSTEGVFAPLGDLTPNGSLDAYRTCWDPALGGDRWRTRPVLGPAERSSVLDFGSSTYFGEALGPASRGYYRFALGGWEVLALDSTCGGDGCGPESAQYRWLARELSVPGACRVAYLNATPATSGNEAATPLFDLLEEEGVQAIVSGGSYGYRRSTAAAGTVHFNAGTGGRLLPATVDPALTLEQRVNNQPGILRLHPDAAGLHHSFLTPTGEAFDIGTIACTP